MKIKLLRQVAKEYQENRSFFRRLVGEGDKSANILTFIDGLKNKPDDYELTHDELFSFTVLIRSSRRTLAASCRRKLYYEHCLELISLFEENNCFTQDIDIRTLSDLFPRQLNTLDRLFVEIQRYGLVSIKNINQMIQISHSNIPISKEELLKELLTKLNQTKQLNDQTFAEALSHFQDDEKPVPPVSVVKKSRKETNLPRSELVLDEKKHFYIEHDLDKEKYPSGSEGVIKKLFASAESKEPVSSLKRIKNHLDVEPQQSAEREVRANRLFGYDSHWFSRHNKFYVMRPWHAGQSLDDIDERALAQKSFSDKLKMIFSGLKCLARLHAIRNVHGDVKPSNFIVNLEQNSLILIDGASVRKYGVGGFFAFTPSFLDNSGRGVLFCDDVYAMSFIVAAIFPEWYREAYDGLTEKFFIEPKPHPPKNDVHFKAINQLMNRMIDKQRDQRCLASEAVTYCDLLLEHLDNLTREKTEEISSKVFRHDVASFDALVFRLA